MSQLSKKFLGSNTVVDAKVEAGAAIAYSKLALSNSIVNADINSAAAITYSKLSLTGSILNADLSASAAIANSKLANMATLTLKGNNTGGSAAPSDLTVAQVNAILPVFTSTLNGLAPLSGGGTTNFLRADGTWAAPSGTGTVTTVSVVLANGLAGSVATATTTPAITLSTTVTGVVKGNGTALSAATSGTDYSAGTSGLTTGILKSTTTTGALTIAVAADFPTLNQNTTGTAANITASSNSTLTTLSALSLPGTQVTGNISGNAANVTGTVVIANGGTGYTTKAAAFDALQPMTTGGDIIYGGASGTGTRLANGSSGQFLQSNGGTAAPTWNTASGVLSYRSVTTTDTATTADHTLSMSGASFTETLFTAVGNAGKILVLLHSGTSITQVYTLNTTGGQTIGGVASGSYALYTNGESLMLQSDGSNWLILQHNTISDLGSFTPNSSQGFGTLTAITLKRWRIGNTIRVQGSFTCGTVTAAEARIDFYAAGATLSTVSLTAIEMRGGWNRDSNGTSFGGGYILVESGVGYFTFGFQTTGSGGLSKLNASTAVNNTNRITIDATVQISGWQP